MQHILLLILFVVSPILLFSQSTDTEKRMQELGFVKVDLNTLSKTQSAPQKACSSCPLKQGNLANTKINHEHEIEKLNNQLPNLEQTIQDLQVSNPTDPMLQKYQTALKNTKDRVKALEKEFAQLKSSSK